MYSERGVSVVSGPVLRGYVQLNRKKLWVLRHIELYADGKITYTKDRKDTQLRGAYHLKDCSIKEMKDEKGQKIIVINTISDKPVTLKLMFETGQVHTQWMEQLLKVQAESQDNRFGGRVVAQSEAPSDAASFTQEMQSTMLSQLNNAQRSSSNLLKVNTQPNSGFQSVDNDNENYMNIIDHDLFTKISDNELLKTKALVNGYLSEFDQKDFILSDNQHNLQLYTDKIFKPLDPLKDAVDAFAYPVVQAMEGVKSSVGGVGFKVIMAAITIALVYAIYYIGILFNVLPMSFSIILALNLVLIPLFSARFANYLNKLKKEMGQRESQKYKLIGQAYFSHNVNEILYGLTQHKDRPMYQLNCENVNASGNILNLTYFDGSRETIQQIIYKEEYNIYCIELQNDTREIQRLVKLCINPFDSGTHVFYYTKTLFSRLYELKNQHSPQILTGLDFYLKTQKVTTNSEIFKYYKSVTTKGSYALYNSMNGGSKSYSKSPVQRQLSAISDQEEEEKEKIQPQQTIDNSSPNKSETKTNDTPAAPEQPPTLEFQSELHKQIYYKLEEKQKVFDQYANLSPEWNAIEDKPNNKVHCKTDPETKLTMSRGECVMNVGQQELYDYIMDMNQKKDYDEMFKEGKQLEKFPYDIAVSYNRMKGKFPVSDRDFVISQRTFKFGDKWYIVGSSVLHENCPPVKGAVRGEIIIGGWILEKLGEKQTRGTYITMADPNGKIPEAIKSWAAKLQGHSVNKIRNIVEKKFA